MARIGCILLLITFSKVQLFSANNNVISKKNLEIIYNLIDHYDIRSMFMYIVSKDVLDAEMYLRNFLNMKKDLTFNIYKKTTKYLKMTEISDLLFVVPNSTKSLEEIFVWKPTASHLTTKLVILIVNSNISYEKSLFMLVNANALIILDGTPFKCKVLDKIFQELISVEDFLLTDKNTAPESFWPDLVIDYEKDKFTESHFPLIINIKNRRTGLLVYFAEAFEKYYKSRLERNVEKSKLINRHRLILLLFPDVTHILEGYPLKITQICFMLPVMDEISEQDFLKKPFEKSVWILILLFVIYFTISLRILLIKDLFLSFYESLAITAGSIQYGVNNKCVYIQLFLYGFIIWNIHNAKLSSYLTTPNIGKILKTVEDVKAANITLWGNFYKKRTMISHMDFMKKFNPNIHKYETETFKGKFISNISHKIFNNHLYSYDISHGYLVNEIVWNFLSHSQTLLKRKKFTYSKLCPKVGFIYPFASTNLYISINDIMSLFTLRTLENGLDMAWEQLSYNDIKFKFLKDDQDIPWNVLGFPYFEVCWWILVLGLTCSIFIFGLEVFVREFQSPVKMIKFKNFC